MRIFTADEPKAIASELGTVGAAIVRFAAATGQSGRRSSVVTSTGTAVSSRCGARRPFGPAVRFRSREPLWTRWRVPARIDSRYVFTTSRRCPSVGMIQAHYGTLIYTAHDAILTRLEAIS